MDATKDTDEITSQHSEDTERSPSQQGFTDDDAKDAFEQELIAFKTSVVPKLENLIDLLSQEYSADIQAGTPDRDELRRLLDLQESLTRDRATVLRLRAAIDNDKEVLEQCRKDIPMSKSANRAVLTKKFNQCIATHRIMDLRQEALTHAAELGKLLKMCDVSLDTLQSRMIYDDIAAGTPPAGTAPAATDGVNGATATSTPPADATAAEHRHNTPELTRAEAHNPSTKDRSTPDQPADDVGKDFGDSMSPHASRTPLHGGSGGTPLPPSSDRARHPSPRRARGTPLPSCHGTTGSIFGPLRSDVATSSSSSTRAPTSPLAFTTDGKSLLPAKDSRPDFSLYGSNPFYLHSLVKLPIPVDISYDSSTKQPIMSQTQLQPLPPPTFDGDFRLWPRFRDAFIRLVHAPGRYLSDQERLQYLLQALKGDALTIAVGYNRGLGDGNYHLATAALEEEYFRPFQACKLLRHEFQQLKPRSNNPEALRQFVDLTIQYVGLLRTYDCDLNTDRTALDNWWEKIPHQTRLEMCRTLDVDDASLSFETSVKTLKRVVKWQTTAAILSPTCGLGQPKSSGTPHAITAGSSGPIITEVKDDERAVGYFGTPKGRTDISATTCRFCHQRGDHWTSRCPAYDTATKRKERALQLGYCLLCLHTGHIGGSSSCRANTELCRFCHAATHHKALCTKYLRWYKERTKTWQKNDNRRSRRQIAGRTPSPQPERAATTSLEEPADGPTKPSTTKVDVPDSPSGHLPAEVTNQDVSSPLATEMQQSLAARENTRDFGHESDAPSEPDHSDEEGFYDVDDPDAAPLDGVGTFGAAVPSGAELCRTHLLECVTAEVFNPDYPSRSKTATKTFVFEDLATDLGLINLGRKELILDTFANDKAVKLDTFETKIGLLTTKRERIVLDAAASPRVVRQPRTAFIKPEDVRELRRNKCILVPEYVAPDIVIGRDKQHLFRKRDIFPALPSGFCLVKSTLGTMVAGLGSVPELLAELRLRLRARLHLALTPLQGTPRRSAPFP